MLSMIILKQLLGILLLTGMKILKKTDFKIKTEGGSNNSDVAGYLTLMAIFCIVVFFGVINIPP